MAVSNFRALQAFEAGADLSKSEGLVVKLDTSGKAVLATAATDYPVGIIVETAAQGLFVGVCTEHGVKVPARTAGAITSGARVAITANGRITTAAAAAASIGTALESSTAADQYITILYTGKVQPAA